MFSVYFTRTDTIERMAADLEFSAIDETHIAEVSRFLRATFQAGEDWLPFKTAMVRWKALAPHPLWDGSRGYVIRREGEIVAHGCAMPTRFLYAGGEALVACIIDWAATKTAPGTGVMVYQDIGALTDGLIGVGGSDEAQKVLPRLGLKPRQTMETYVKVMDPVAAFLETGEKTWRDAARLGRDLLRKMAPAKGNAIWTAERIPEFDGRVLPVLPRPGVISATVCYRSPALLNYFLRCPGPKMEGFLLHKKGKLGGYFILAQLRSECRIAELWIDSAEDDDWAAAYLVAAEGRSSVRVSVGCAIADLQRAAQRAGFHLAAHQPIYIKDSNSRLPTEVDAALGMLDTDAFYL